MPTLVFPPESVARSVSIPTRGPILLGDLHPPPEGRPLVVFAHGSGSGRTSPRNRAVAARLRESDLGTLLLDLLTQEEEVLDERTGHLRFDVALLAKRLSDAAWWAEAEGFRNVAYFGASTGAAAALLSAAEPGVSVRSIVSRGGRPDLAGPALADVTSPTLLVVGGEDRQVLELNRLAYGLLRCEKRLEVVPGAGHLFQEKGTLARLAELAADWFVGHAQESGGAS